MTHKKQHIVSEAYLKYFSKEDDGKGILTLCLNNPYKLKIELHNSGDRIFWAKNFYNTTQFQNSKTIELFFGQKIENDYHSIIKKIVNQVPIKDEKFKILIFQWVFYSKLRSPMWRKYLQFIIKEKGINLKFDSKELREEHLQFFSNSDMLNSFIEYYNESLIVKKWKILICPDNYNWITSDNPGFAVATKEFAKNPKEYDPNPLWTNIQYDTALYFPLTKKYCLEIFPYNQNDDVKRNFDNDNIVFEKANPDTSHLINNWTARTSHEIIISSSQDELLEYEEIIKKST
jgi:hypothetical protein